MANIFDNVVARMALFALLAGLLVAAALALLAPRSDLADFSNVIGLGGVIGAVLLEAVVRRVRRKKP